MANLQETGDGMPGRAPPCCSWPPARPFLVARHPITILTERQALTSASLPLPRQRFSTIRLIAASAPPAHRLRLQTGIDMSRRKRAIELPDETSEALRARLRRFVRATRDDVTRAVPIPFPTPVTVLAGPLRRIRGARGHRTVPGPEARAGLDARSEDGDKP
ncbi:hypothetical protein [Paraburkholderia tuberum]|uniref:Uncharacterized protein n=1 Tax=Paraburkholderia tuberum TaxID=157910 RepID=A0A1H1KHT1_9BURK|nr:hypothetical protein [Paraburkholderia tuberum]SDR61891.1 hypothetical protein SAMN05445850_8023 [Paraburkholderia tuberum]